MIHIWTVHNTSKLTLSSSFQTDSLLQGSLSEQWNLCGQIRGQRLSLHMRLGILWKKLRRQRYHCLRYILWIEDFRRIWGRFIISFNVRLLTSSVKLSHRRMQLHICYNLLVATSLNLNLNSLSMDLKNPGGRGDFSEFWWECAARFSKHWPYFGPKYVFRNKFHTYFQTMTWFLQSTSVSVKSIPVFRLSNQNDWNHLGLYPISLPYLTPHIRPV